MSIEDELYYETHEDTLRQEYQDFLLENNYDEKYFSFEDFLQTF